MSGTLSVKTSHHSLKPASLGVLRTAVESAQYRLLADHHPDGYWWYTLEANDSINAEYLMLLKYLGVQDVETEKAIACWIVKNQNTDGSWSLYHLGAGDVSATVECYLALKMIDNEAHAETLKKAQKFILAQGGITKIRIFTRIHLALFGLVDWKICPNMPVALIQLPDWAPINIYEFSSWARASIVPLLIIMDQKKTKIIPDLSLDELYVEDDPKTARWTYEVDAGLLSLETIFINADKTLQLVNKLKFKPLRKISLKKCEKFVREHLGITEDIFPALFYGILALHSLENTLEDPGIEKALLALKSFQVITSHNDLVCVPFKDGTSLDYNVITKKPSSNQTSPSVYQQCCISPIWDTAWAGVALLESGTKPNDEKLLKTAQWLLSKQVTDVMGDWGVKNPQAEPGGWSFEFNNKHYPDVDDTIEVLTYLCRVDLPYRVLAKPIERGVSWLLSMQCKNGGFAAFDKDNNLEILNKLPFADHGACLDPATADITGRVIEFLVETLKYDKKSTVLQRAADFTVAQQEKDGSFWGRWGVNYLYGTWCAVTGLRALRRDKDGFVIDKAMTWLKSLQNKDGGFGESCESYKKKKFVACDSTPSQTAWALMTFVANGEAESAEAKKATGFLISSQTKDGGWDEEHFTGTGFPGHFYIRYHGYRYYFPLLALARYHKEILRM